MNFNRPFIYLLWKDRNNPNASNTKNDRLEGVQIPETVVITKNLEFSKDNPYKIDWFFHSEKQNMVMKRHAHHVNIVVFQNFFLKRKQAGPNY